MIAIDGRHRGCSGCAWNDGVERIKNELGFRDSWLRCGFYGFLPIIFSRDRARRCEFWRREKESKAA